MAERDEQMLEVEERLCKERKNRQKEKEEAEVSKEKVKPFLSIYI